MVQQHSLTVLQLFHAAPPKMIAQPDGGSMVEQRPAPKATDSGVYWRYYCTCTQVGGRRSAEIDSLYDFYAHKKENEPV